MTSNLSQMELHIRVKSDDICGSVLKLHMQIILYEGNCQRLSYTEEVKMILIFTPSEKIIPPSF